MGVTRDVEWAGMGFIEPKGGTSCTINSNSTISFSHTCPYCGQWVTDSQNHYCSGPDPKVSCGYFCEYCGQWVNGSEPHYYPCGRAYSYWNVPLAELRNIVRLLEEIRDLLKKDE